jgi:hypothetical protein
VKLIILHSDPLDHFGFTCPKGANLVDLIPLLLPARTPIIGKNSLGMKRRPPLKICPECEIFSFFLSSPSSGRDDGGGHTDLLWRQYPMANYHIPQPQNVRKINGSFAWLDHRLMRNGFVEVMTADDLLLYMFLVLVADRNGVSFYRKEKICDTLSLDWRRFEIARDRLIFMQLIAFEAYSVCSPNGHYQVLPVGGRPPDFRARIRLPVPETGKNKNVST